MKKLMIVCLLGILTVNVVAQNYEIEMLSRINKIYTLPGKQELTTLAQEFERIGQSEQNQWLPYYYSSLSYVYVLFSNHDLKNETKDKYLDLAENRLNDLRKLKTFDKSEVYALQTLIYQMRIFTPSRGKEFSMKAGESLEMGLKANDQNPRLYYLQGMNIMNTPKFFGGGADKAKPSFEKAKILFSQTSRTDPLSPNWGEIPNNSTLDKINQ